MSACVDTSTATLIQGAYTSLVNALDSIILRTSAYARSVGAGCHEALGFRRTELSLQSKDMYKSCHVHACTASVVAPFETNGLTTFQVGVQCFRSTTTTTHFQFLLQARVLRQNTRRRHITSLLALALARPSCVPSLLTFHRRSRSTVNDTLACKPG